MDERTLDRIFSGSLKDLPPVLSKIVRIFTSSTFTDMTLERNTLMENVYPKIKEYCKEKHGLEFQVVDMRWGVRDEATDDHMTTDLCMNEIKNCQRLSVGPNFVTFLGQKYGYRPIPTYIKGSEFRLLCRALENLEITEVELLYQWYREDTNAVPATFILQPISTILCNFLNKEQPELMAKDQAIWWDTLAKLQKIMRIAAVRLHEQNLLTDEEKHNYIMAVTEREVINGVLKMKETRNTCIGYIRQINKINMANTKLVGNFVDLLAGEVDQEAQDLLGDLRDSRLVNKIHPDNIVKYKLDWSDNAGLNDVDHYDYLVEFINHFYKNIVKLVRRAMRKEDSSAFGRIVTEILQHSHSCNTVSRIFLGRGEELQTIKEYICGSGEDRFRRPLLLHGLGGSGKTSLLAKAASMTMRWINKPKGIMVLRFLGTTPDSSSVIPTLTSLCQQLAYNYTLPMDQMPDDLIPLTFYFKQLLLNATFDSPLIIFLDSVDQLDGPNEVSIKLGWMTYELPEHVRLILSCVSEGDCEEYSFLRRTLLKTSIESDQFLEVKTLTKDLAVDIINEMLKFSSRSLSSTQWKIVKATLDHCTLPIFVKLVFARVSAWKSYTKATLLSTNVMESIMSLFERVELQHGTTLVSFALSYITASKCGLSESELEDLISLDDIVLNDIYQYHLPPTRRIPPLLWTRIRSDLPNYLTERDADGNWYHRQFRDTSIIRYLTEKEKIEYFHSMLADYFIGMWGGGTEKPFKFTEVQKNRFKLESDEGKADRKVPVQPNVYYANDGSVARFNTRKFGELPFHLGRANRFDDLYQMVLFNYEWLHSKLSSCPLQSVLNDFEDCKNQLKLQESFDTTSHRQVQLMVDAIRLAAAILIQYPSMFAPQIIARLLPLKDECPLIAGLLRQCDEQGINHCSLLPIGHCLHTPGGPLMYSLEGHSFAVFDFILTSDHRYILSVSNKFLMWDLSTGEVSREVDPQARGIMQVLVITGDDKLALTYSNYNDIWALDILTGEIHTIHAGEVGLSEAILGVEVAEDNKSAIVWNRDSWVVFTLHPGLKVANKFDVKDEIDDNVRLVTMSYEGCNRFHLTYLYEEQRVTFDGEKHDEGHSYSSMTKYGMSSEPTPKQYYLQTFLEGQKIEVLKFVGGILVLDDICYAAQMDGRIHKYKCEDRKWIEELQLPDMGMDKTNVLLAMNLANSDDHIICFRLRGFQVYRMSDFRPMYFALPSGVRNISVKSLEAVSRLVFTKFNQYAVAGIRRSLYIWAVGDGTLLKTIDAHYDRIVEMLPLVVDEINAVATSSLDRTVKVWNIKNIFETVYVIDRMELPIESVTFATDKPIVATVTRSSVGLWDTETAKLWETVSDSAIGAIVTHAVIIPSGNFLVTIESGKLLFWDLRSGVVLSRRPVPEVKHLQLVPRSNLIIMVSKSDNQDILNNSQETYCVTCVSHPGLETDYELTFVGKKKEALKAPVITLDGQFLVIASLQLFEVEKPLKKESKSEEKEEKKIEKDVFQIYSVSSGKLVRTIEFLPFTQLIPVTFKGKENVVAVLTPGTGYIIDIISEKIISKVSRWNGQCTSDGRLGIFASPRGALEVLELQHGSTVRVLLPRASEGLVSYTTGFTSNDQYVYYYHSTKRTIRLFRVEDGEMIANYRLSAEAKVVTSSPDGSSLVIGGADGSLIVLLICDPKKPDCLKNLKNLPSRIDAPVKKRKKSTATWKAAAQLAKFGAKRGLSADDTNGCASS